MPEQTPIFFPQEIKSLAMMLFPTRPHEIGRVPHVHFPCSVRRERHVSEQYGESHLRAALYLEAVDQVDELVEVGGSIFLALPAGSELLGWR